MRRHTWVSVLVSTLTLTESVRADEPPCCTDTTVGLADEKSVRARLIERVPGDHVWVFLASGEEVRLADAKVTTLRFDGAACADEIQTVDGAIFRGYVWPHVEGTDFRRGPSGALTQVSKPPG
jgi:hypothetical protein